MYYQPDLYITDEKNSCRFVLGQSGNKPLFVFGLNPSRADDHKADQTLSKVLGFAQRKDYDSFYMLNLYPKRCTWSEKLDKRMNTLFHERNLIEIEKLIAPVKNPQFLACWGDIILLRPYFMRCLKSIVERTQKSDPEWMRIGNLTKKGHPRHPSRASYMLNFETFDIESYLIH